ncbi:MAG TPA: SEC-C metal-binding domain-containing protein, partial [Stellaceae bacterium]|nr:SEC-C metal-binding domain-containing protein [Stellaceae bacterium]
KDHLYDLDQLRAAIHYRSWGQKDPLIEYKHEAYNMFVDLMTDIYNSFAERFLRAQIVFEPPPELAAAGAGARGSGPNGGDGRSARPAKRFNALGVLEEADASGSGDGGAAVPAAAPVSEGAVDVKPPPPRKAPTVVGAGRLRSIDSPAPKSGSWGNVGRNDPCPCGSGKKYKKCHGANA